MNMPGQDTELRWFAARVIRERSYVLKYMDCEKIEHAGIADLRSLVFFKTTCTHVESLRSALYDRVLFYRNSDKTAVEPIPDSIMQTFLIMAPFHDEPVIYLPVDSPAFFQGKRKRVTGGVFAGCEGIVKRIKGERRLIVRINDRAAIATPYIPQEFLEDVESI